MAVVTLSRQLGSLGFEIAQLVAQRTGYQLVWRELINQAAIRAGAPEVALAMIDELNLLGLKPSPEEMQAYLSAVRVVMNELADAGNVVIVGRAGQIILANRPQALHVRVTAPVSLRVERLAKQQGIPMAAARAQVDASDRYHQNYFKRYYKLPWDGSGLYDLIINTTKLNLADAAEIICIALGKCASCSADSLPPAGDPL
jgi:cytidylate kinase